MQPALRPSIAPALHSRIKIPTKNISFGTVCCNCTKWNNVSIEGQCTNCHTVTVSEMATCHTSSSRIRPNIINVGQWQCCFWDGDCRLEFTFLAVTTTRSGLTTYRTEWRQFKNTFKDMLFSGCSLLFNIYSQWIFCDQKWRNYIDYQHWISDSCGLSATVCDRKLAACWKSLPVVCGCLRFNA